MKYKFLVAAGAAIAAAAVTVYVNNEKNTMDDFFSANVEALAEGEIVVGNLCMVQPNRACTSLGEVFEEHVRP